jgi:hypothetical protein
MNMMNMHWRDIHLTLREDRPTRCHENRHQDRYQGHDAISHFETSSVVRHSEDAVPSESNSSKIARRR